MKGEVYSGKAISRAGMALLEPDLATEDPPAFEEAMNALSYWRACHEVPLEHAYELLGEVAGRVDRRSVIAKRLKRTPSIVAKLRRFDGMRLRSMQDIGGCRAILRNKKSIAKVVRELKLRKHFKIKDYIKKPKDDGYRGMHLVGDFCNENQERRSIEIQLRTTIQHSWATAVEIIDLFTGQAIKSNRGSGEWKAFFRCVAEIFAVVDTFSNYDNLTDGELFREFVNGVFYASNSQDRERLSSCCEQVYMLEGKLNIIRTFKAFAATLKVADERLARESLEGYVLLWIDTRGQSLRARIFGKNDFDHAAQEYLRSEKDAATIDGLVVALVSTDAVGGLKQAFPNYFADSTNFLRLLILSVESYKHQYPNRLLRAIGTWVRNLRKS